MKVIKKINNNVAVCLDDNQNELIAIGKGIGFRTVPYELTNLSIVERTYYGISPEYMGLFRELPKEVFDVAGVIVDYAASHIDAELNRNLLLTLADHINFAVDRCRKNIHVKPPYIGNLAYLHETEYGVAQKAVTYINQQFHVHLPKEEAAAIALHFINAENAEAPEANALNEAEVISDVLCLIEAHFNITIDRAGFNCSRFVTHMEYLLARIRNHEILDHDNEKLFSTLQRDYPEICECAQMIRSYLCRRTEQELGSEELVYLMLHIERLCAREQG